MSDSSQQQNPQADLDQSPSLLQVFLSVLGAFFGVQSKETRERDFQHGKFYQFAIIGLVVAITFVLMVWGLVSVVMHFAGV